jgi:hypothetical protein
MRIEFGFCLAYHRPDPPSASQQQQGTKRSFAQYLVNQGDVSMLHLPNPCTRGDPVCMKLTRKIYGRFAKTTYTEDCLCPVISLWSSKFFARTLVNGVSFILVGVSLNSSSPLIMTNWRPGLLDHTTLNSICLGFLNGSLTLIHTRKSSHMYMYMESTFEFTTIILAAPNSGGNCQWSRCTFVYKWCNKEMYLWSLFGRR